MLRNKYYRGLSTLTVHVFGQQSELSINFNCLYTCDYSYKQMHSFPSNPMNKSQINMYDNTCKLNIEFCFWKRKLLYSLMEEFVKCDKETKKRTSAQVRCKIKFIWRILHELVFFWHLSTSEGQADRNGHFIFKFET